VARGAGVSTIATGLAASLSETGEGNVLLVDMNLEHGATHQFYKGDLTCALDDALELEKRDGAMVSENLYVVSELTKNGRLPKRAAKTLQEPGCRVCGQAITITSFSTCLR
jgi:Mrp family chromosome partitioning ATPase